MKTMKSKTMVTKTGASVTLIKSKSSTGATYFKPVLKVRSGKEIEEFKKDLSIDDHMISLEELINRYSTDLDTGLSISLAEHLLKVNGPNCLVASATKSTWLILIGFLFGGFNLLLWSGALLTLIGYGISRLTEKSTSPDSLYLGIVLIAVAVFSGFFNFYQEKTNSAIMESFKKMVPKFATVIRDGENYIIPSEEIVTGDLVQIKIGDLIPADVRLINTKQLKVDNSVITGESYAVSRGLHCTDSDPLETHNLAFFGTSVVQGSGYGIVINCGHNTVIGRIAGLASSLTKSETLIHKELDHFIKVITIVAIITGVTFFIISMFIGYGFFKSFSFFIAIVIANVPEGIPVCLVACMSLTARRMANKNCLVKKLECIETLGACNVICSDKTGTLTQNKMTASHLTYDGSEFDVLNSFDCIDRDSESFHALCNIAILCSQASFETDSNKSDMEIDNWKTTGDASESAILKLMEKLFGNVEKSRERSPKVCEIPFNSFNKYQVSIHQQNGKNILVMKGAPERVLDHCEYILRDGELLEKNEQTTKSIKKLILSLGKKGERILAFADLVLSKEYGFDYCFDADTKNFPMMGFRFVGMISLIDPPRPSVPDAVAKCRKAGIKVVMVTGDHPVTATAIAQKVGIISQTHYATLEIVEEKLTKVDGACRSAISAVVITGANLREMDDLTLEETLNFYREIVFARTSPQQKLKIVEALQRLKLVVAVTGDGVNDSPALKKADIGIAMGITGSSVSKEAADMILLDDNFASIITAIEEGRLIFDNLKKCIAYALTSNVPEIIPFIILIILNIPEALSVIAIIIIDVGTDLWPAISLAYEQPETDIMNRKPRDPNKDRLINRRTIFLTYGQIGLIQACASFVAYLYIMAGHGYKLNRLLGIRYQWESESINDLEDSYGQEWTYAQRQILTRKGVSAYFLSIIITQIADLLICKTRRLSLLQQGMTNHVLNASLMFELFLAGVLVYCPGLNTVFQFEPIDLTVMVSVLPFAFLIIAYDEIRKLIIRFNPGGFIDKETY